MISNFKPKFKTFSSFSSNRVAINSACPIPLTDLISWLLGHLKTLLCEVWSLGEDPRDPATVARVMKLQKLEDPALFLWAVPQSAGRSPLGAIEAVAHLNK
jgi:hypothetical protein